MSSQEIKGNSIQARAGAGIVLLLMMVCLLVPGPGKIEGRWMNAFWDLAHVPAFFLVFSMVHLFCPSGWKQEVRLLVATTVSLILAVGSEWAQTFFEREGSWKDVKLDAIGIGLALFRHASRSWFSRPRAWFSAVAALALVSGLWPAWGAELAEFKQRRKLPELGTFSFWETRYLWRPQGSADVEVEHGRLLVRIRPGHFGGVSFQPGRQNWKEFSHLVIEIKNPGEPFELGIRIDDAGSRAEGGGWLSFGSRIEKGEQQLEFTIHSEAGEESPIDLTEVSRLALFTGHETQGREFLVKSAFLR